MLNEKQSVAEKGHSDHLKIYVNPNKIWRLSPILLNGLV